MIWLQVMIKAVYNLSSEAKLKNTSKTGRLICSDSFLFDDVAKYLDMTQVALTFKLKKI